MRSVKVKTEF